MHWLEKDLVQRMTKFLSCCMKLLLQRIIRKHESIPLLQIKEERISLRARMDHVWEE
jgi:hypothetical protein